MAWRAIAPSSSLEGKGRAVARVDGRQVLLLKTARGLYACNNRCPHEGYPLSEGSLAEGCVLTCNWHNWKFNLETGETLVGGDALRRYPAKIETGQVWIDWAELDAKALSAKALSDLEKALTDQDYARIARELARLERHGGDPLSGLSRAVLWSHDRFEFGMTHAYAAAADWLALRDAANDPVRRLAALVEAIAYMAEDAEAERFPYAEAQRPWDTKAFLEAIEAEDEPGAVAHLRGALAAGTAPADLRPALARAALAHYQDFGHAAIYTLKAVELVRHLDREAAGAVLLSLARSLVYASREDLLPEFRFYAEARASWGKGNGKDPPPLAAAELQGKPAKTAMRTVAAWSPGRRPGEIYQVLLSAAAAQMLHFDRRYEQRTDGPIADNVGWLDFTHAITFANAGRVLASADPALWPAVLLQIACFIGRNAKYVDPAQDAARWRTDDPAAFFAAAADRLYDHGVGEFIVSAHLVKTTLAAKAEAEAAPAAAGDLAAAMNRFLGTPIKRRHALRTARQMRDFVAEE
ncbi:MAG: Rieske (2Fe-2S) protein [Rhodospirillales bacterium]